MCRAFVVVKHSVVAAVLLLTSGVAFGQQDDKELRDQFIQGVLQAAAKIEKVTFRAKCTFTSRNVTVSEEVRAAFAKSKQDPLAKSTQEFECAVRGDHCLRRSTEKNGLEVLKVRNSSYVFGITRTADQRRPTLRFLEQLNTGESMDPRINEIENEIRGLSLAAFYLWGTQLSTAVQSKDFTIHRVSAVQTDGKSLVRVEFEHEVNNPGESGKVLYQDGYLICDPAKDWALTEYGAYYKTDNPKFNGKVHRALELAPSQGGIPWASKAVGTTTYTESNSTSESVCLTQVLSVDNIADEEFYLTHYGLPEPSFSHGRDAAWVTYLVGGIACIGFGTFITRWRRVQN